jgi:predicted transcriptional regulator
MSGDLQGLSRKSRAASESVDELLEEGNAYEAGILKGVEEAEEAKEVTTHEVLADDVPEEYLDEE